MFHLLLAIIYISFISLGLPDALLGSAWPIMHEQFQVPVSWMGPVTLIISGGTVVSSLLSDRITRRFGTGKVTAVSVVMTACALLGFGFSDSYWLLCLWAIPFGLGAGGVDSALNNYVALHYASRHMSWLHCMWGLGASAGPYIMGFVLTAGQPWNSGYLYVGVLQVMLAAVLFFTLSLWKTNRPSAGAAGKNGKALSVGQIFRIPGAKAVMLAFFCYCAFEQTLGQWASSYFAMHIGLAKEEAASLAAMFYIGITAGRAVSGFLTLRFTDKQLVRLGIGLIFGGIVIALFPFGKTGAVIGILLMGLGCAPIYPCVIHSTPEIFGAENSQAVIGVEMASAYIGTCLMPPLFGVLAEWIGIWCLLYILLLIAAVMCLGHELLYRKK